MKRLAEIALRPSDRSAIEEAVRLLRQRFPVEEIVLFGSKARGEDDAESDIDLLVLTTRELSRSERHEIVDALFPLQLQHEVVLSPLIVAAQEWRAGLTSVHPIHQEIEEQGVAA
jgi:predicted nucleotidyltransferase